MTACGFLFSSRRLNFFQHTQKNSILKFIANIRLEQVFGYIVFFSIKIQKLSINKVSSSKLTPRFSEATYKVERGRIQQVMTYFTLQQENFHFVTAVTGVI